MSGPGAKPSPHVQPKLRLDKWLWQARFFKSRSLAADLVSAGYLRINSQRCLKASHGVAVGDVLTFSQGRTVRVVRVTALGLRRGSAVEAQTLFDDLAGAPASQLSDPE